jgi:hypothetical protein
MGQRPVAEWLRASKIRGGNDADKSIDTPPRRVPE